MRDNYFLSLNLRGILGTMSFCIMSFACLNGCKSIDSGSTMESHHNGTLTCWNKVDESVKAQFKLNNGKFEKMKNGAWATASSYGSGDIFLPFRQSVKYKEKDYKIGDRGIYLAVSEFDGDNEHTYIISVTTSKVGGTDYGGIISYQQNNEPKLTKLANITCSI